MQSISVVFPTLHCEGYIADLRYRWLMECSLYPAILKSTRHFCQLVFPKTLHCEGTTLLLSLRYRCSICALVQIFYCFLCTSQNSLSLAEHYFLCSLYPPVLKSTRHGGQSTERRIAFWGVTTRSSAFTMH